MSARAFPYRIVTDGGGRIVAAYFDNITGADLPNPSASTLGGIESYAAVSHQWINAISTSGVPSSTQPAFTDISGTLGIGAGGTGQATAVAAKDALTTKGADIASATTTDLSTATGEYVHVTGTTTITALGTCAAGVQRVVEFTGALTLTHNSTSLVLPGAANITTAAGDLAIFRSEGSGNWRCVNYERAATAPYSGSGTPTGSAGGVLTGTYPNPGLAAIIPQAETFITTDAATVSAAQALSLGHNTSGTPGAGFGVQVLYELQDSATTNQAAAIETVSWVVATHGSTTARKTFALYGSPTEYLRGEVNASNAAMIGFLGAAASLQLVSPDLATLATTFGLASGSPTLAESKLTLTDITTNNVSTSAHGFAPKAPNDATKYLDGTGAYSNPTPNSICNGRLTVTSGTPVPTADVASATSIYWTPYNGNGISLWNGSAWQLYTFTEITIALGTLTSGKPYDVFAYVSGGAVAIDTPLVWTNDSTRATAVTLQDGVYCKSGDKTRRYLGTFYTVSTTATADVGTPSATAAAFRYVWNMYNQVPRHAKIVDTTSHTYATNTTRQWDANGGNQINFVVGQPVGVLGGLSSGDQTTTAGVFGLVSVALDSTTTEDAIAFFAGAGEFGGGANSAYTPAAGRHFLSVNERAAGGTATFASVRAFAMIPG